jgi:hypothetical protein
LQVPRGNTSRDLIHLLAEYKVVTLAEHLYIPLMEYRKTTFGFVFRTPVLTPGPSVGTLHGSVKLTLEAFDLQMGFDVSESVDSQITARSLTEHSTVCDWSKDFLKTKNISLGRFLRQEVQNSTTATPLPDIQ